MFLPLCEFVSHTIRYCVPLKRCVKDLLEKVLWTHSVTQMCLTKTANEPSRHPSADAGNEWRWMGPVSGVVSYLTDNSTARSTHTQQLVSWNLFLCSWMLGCHDWLRLSYALHQWNCTKQHQHAAQSLIINITIITITVNTSNFHICIPMAKPD